MNGRVLACLLALFLPAQALAQDTGDKGEQNQYRNEVGFNLGSTSGMGFSYRHWINRVGFQVTALPYKTGRDFFMSTGLTGMLTLRQEQRVRIFLYWGNSILLDNSYHTESYDYTNERGEHCTRYEERRVLSSQCNTGFGLGFSLGRIVAFNVSLGYGAYNVFGGFDDMRLLPCGELGLYWRF